ncbi:MAG: alpha/beta fold hydrolase [Candidatus Rokuibacteriota bacterium]
MPHAAVNGVDLLYEVTGAGVPLIFSHEYAGDARSWEPQVRFFSRFYRCVTYNHRGFPPSTVPSDPAAYSLEILVEDLAALLDHLGLAGPVHLVGLAMGGSVALHFALRSPERCRSLVVAATGSGTGDAEAYQQKNLQVIELLATRGMRAYAEAHALEPTRIQLRHKDPRGWLEFREQLASHSAEGAALTRQGVQGRRPPLTALQERLSALAVPTLIVAGDEDTPCLQPALFLKRAIPAAGLAMFPRTGHTINLEEPALFNRVVLDFLHAVEAERWRPVTA